MKHKKRVFSLRRMLAVAAATLAVSSAMALAAPALAMANSGSLTYEKGGSYVTENFNNVEDLLTAAENSEGYVIINLFDDWNTKDYGRIFVPWGRNYSIHLNGHMINRGLVGSYDDLWYGDEGGEVIVVASEATLSIDGGNAATEHRGTLTDDGHFWLLDNNGSTVIKGGLICGGATDSSLKDDGFTGGGGIAARGDDVSITISNTTIAGNVADTFTNSFGHGGGIGLSSYDSKLKLKNTDVIYNHAEGKGGGIAMHDATGSTLEISEGCNIDNNYSDQRAGGIYFDNTDGKLVIKDNCTVSNNRCVGDGGGVYYGGRKGSMELSGGVTIEGNYAAGSGGGLYDNFNGTEFTFSKTTIKNNTAVSDGGGIYLNDVAKLTLKDESSIQGNKANQGGGLFVDDDSTSVLLDNSKIYSNTSAKSGGGIYHNATGGSVTLQAGSLIDSNKALDGNGAGIYNNYSETTYTLTGSSGIYRNFSYAWGGGIYLYDDATVSLKDGSYIRRNTATQNGGGIVNHDADSKIYLSGYSSIDDNTAGEKGGGIHAYKDTHIVGDRTAKIQQNYAPVGAGIYADYELYLKNIAITGNLAKSYGGGVYCNHGDYHALELSDVVIIQGNGATDAGDSNLTMFGNQNACGGDGSNLLSPNSRIGISILEFDGSPYKVSGNKAFLTNVKDDWRYVVFSDDTNRAIQKMGSYLYLIDSKASFELSDYVGDDKTGSRWIRNGSTVTLTTDDYAQEGMTLDYWTVEGVSQVSKLEPQNGMASFTMPANSVVVRPHYTAILGAIELTISENGLWAELGDDLDESEVSAIRLRTVRGASFGINTTNEIRNAVKVTGVSVAVDEQGAKQVTYTIEVSKAVLDNYGIKYLDGELAQSSVSVRASFKRADATDVKVSQASDGALIVSATASFDAPADAVSIAAVNVNKANAKPFDGVVEQVDDVLEPDASANSKALASQGNVVLEVPDEPGWKFIRWSNLPQGATVDTKTGAVTVRADLAAGLELTALYEPLASAVAITVDELKVGEEFPTQISSLLIAGATERDLTNYVKDNIAVSWTKTDGSAAGNTVEGDASYKATITATGQAASYLFGFDDAVRVTVNGDEVTSSLDASAKKQQVTYYASTASDTRYDRLAYKYLNTMVYETTDIDDCLPVSATYLLKNGQSYKAAVTWDKSTVDEAQTSGSFTVKGSFADIYGDSHEVSQNLEIIDLGAPEASYEVAQDGSGAQTITLGKGYGWMGQVEYSAYYLIIDKKTNLDDISRDNFLPYTQPVTIQPGQTLLAFAKVQLANSVKETAIAGYSYSINNAQVALDAKKWTYSSTGVAPAPVVTLGGKELVKDQDYTVSYKHNNKVGCAYVVVEGCGDYTGKVSVSFKIVPVKTKGVAAKAAGKHKVKVSWNKHKAQTDGFQVRYAASKAKVKAGKGKTVKAKAAAKTTKVIKGLKSGKRVYVQVRAYKVVDGKTYYSAWSKVKSVKVK